jgi:hypothetical protein
VVLDKFCNFYLAKNNKSASADNSTTTEAREKMCTDWSKSMLVPIVIQIRTHQHLVSATSWPHRSVITLAPFIENHKTASILTTADAEEKISKDLES